MYLIRKTTPGMQPANTLIVYFYKVFDLHEDLSVQSKILVKIQKGEIFIGRGNKSIVFKWNWDLKLIASDIIRNNPDAIILGNFNATLKHGALNDITTHEDALNYLSWFKRGTWPDELPAYFCIPIDHILLPKDKYTVKKS